MFSVKTTQQFGFDQRAVQTYLAGWLFADILFILWRTFRVVSIRQQFSIVLINILTKLTNCQSNTLMSSAL